MKIHNPLFLPLALVLVIFVALANHNGWSVLNSVASHTWQRTGPATQHK